GPPSAPGPRGPRQNPPAGPRPCPPPTARSNNWLWKGREGTAGPVPPRPVTNWLAHRPTLSGPVCPLRPVNNRSAAGALPPRVTATSLHQRPPAGCHEQLARQGVKAKTARSHLTYLPRRPPSRQRPPARRSA
ncbi:hypothetical protein LTR70_010787, partial [Exophiala xenobiotica]